MDDDAVVQAAKAQLEAELPALLEAAELPAIVEFLDYDPGLPLASKAPQVWVDVVQNRRSDERERGATVQRYAQAPQLFVGVTAAGNDAGKAARQLRQTTDRIRRALEMDPSLGGRVLWVRWVETSYTPNLSKAATGLFKLAGLIFDVNYRTRYTQE